MEWIDNYRNKPEPSRAAGGGACAEQSSARSASPRRRAFTSASSPACSAPIRRTPSAWSARCCRCRRPTNGSSCAPSPIPGCRPGRACWRGPTPKLPARRGMIDAYLTGALPTLDRDRARQEPDLSRKGSASSFGSQAQAAGRILRPQSRNCSTRCGASISPRASTGRCGASSRCCRGRRSATASSGSTVGSVGEIHARQQRRALSRCARADQGDGGLPGARRCGRS